MLVFTNKGEIDPRLIFSFGTSVKDSANPIGYFGTGLKYAIAIALRTGHEVEIVSGLTVYRFGVETDTIRDKQFSFITMNGQTLGFTLDLGKNWEPWMAYRELWCNAKDEGGDAALMLEPPPPAPDITQVRVWGKILEDCHEQRSHYILQSNALHTTYECSIHQGSGVYYRGIRVYTPNEPMVFAYNIHKDLTLTEDRTLRDIYAPRMYITKAIASLTNTRHIAAAIHCNPRCYEYELDFDWGCVEDVVSPEFKAALDKAVEFNSAKINHTLVRLHTKLSPAPESTKYTPTQVEQKMLNKSLHFLETLGFHVPYEIELVESLGGQVLGTVRDQAIVLSREAFVRGTKMVAGTIFEEFVHIRYGVSDESRQMQNLLIDQLMTMGENLVGEPL